MKSAPRKKRESGALREVWIAYNDMVDFVREIAPTQSGSLGVKINRTSNGTTFKAEAGRVTEQLTSKRYLLQGVADDYLSVKEMVGDEVVGDLIYVAKPHELRRTGWHGQTVSYLNEVNNLARPVTYNYVSSIYRTATSGTTVENQAIRPPYVVGKSHIYAIEVENETGVEQAPTLIDINTAGRAFAKI